VQIQVGEKFTALYQDQHEHYAFYGGRGGAKSHHIADWIALTSSKQPERVVCGREFQNSIRDSVKELIEQKIRKNGLEDDWRSTDRELLNVVTGSRISFLGMNRNPESAKSLEGATIFWGEEAQTFTKRSVEIIVPTIRAQGSRMVWSWNSRFRTDEVDVMFRGGVPPEKSYISNVSWRDNLYFYRTRMPSEFRRSLRNNPKRHVHIWEGGYDENPDAAIFTNWSVGRPSHIPDTVIPRFGLDFGFSADPNAAVKVYVIEAKNDDEEDIIYVAQEKVVHNQPIRSLHTTLDSLSEVRDYEVIADSASPSNIDHLVIQDGFNVYGARKGPGSVVAGISLMQGFHIMVDPDCPITASEIKSYMWHLDKSGRTLPKPAEHQQDHCIDAIRYAVEDLTTSLLDEEGGVDHL